MLFVACLIGDIRIHQTDALARRGCWRCKTGINETVPLTFNVGASGGGQGVLSHKKNCPPPPAGGAVAKVFPNVSLAV